MGPEGCPIAVKGWQGLSDFALHQPAVCSCRLHQARRRTRNPCGQAPRGVDQVQDLVEVLLGLQGAGRCRGMWGSNRLDAARKKGRAALAKPAEAGQAALDM